MNITMEELEEAKNLLLDAYNVIGKLPSNMISDKSQLKSVTNVFIEIGAFLDKMGIDLRY